MTMWLAAAASAGTPAPAQVSKPLTLQQAVAKVERDTEGHVLSADNVRSRRSRKYRIKVLTRDGRVEIVEVDSKHHHNKKSTPRRGRDKENH